MSAPTATPTGSLSADGHDVGRVCDAPGQLRAFNDAGVLVPADVHVAATLGRLAGEREPDVLLAAALAVRAPRLGHVCVDLANVRLTVSVDEDVPADVDALPWPEPGDWLDRVARSALVVDAAGDGPGDEPAGDRPLRLSGSRLYLDRYWRYERRVLDDLRSRATAAAGVETTVLRDGLDRLFPTQEGGGPDLQRLAAAAAVLRRFAVVAGGPGTGKTTTVAGILALLEEQATAAGGRPPQVALAAPTGKAADRLQTRVREVAAGLATTERVRERLRGLGASTIHRLLGTRPDSSSRFRHDRVNPLPHDVVVVDETSMVSLSLMAKLLDAVPRGARVLLLGDPEQLVSVEAGAVLGDVVGPVTTELRMTPATRRTLSGVTGQPAPAADPPDGAALGEGVVVLRRVHRFTAESGIAELADAIQRGDPDAAVALLVEGRPDVRWLPATGDEQAHRGEGLQPLREDVVATGRGVFDAARAGDAAGALAALGRLRLLCAHRRGPFGVATWAPVVERWLVDGVDGFDPADQWYVGRPVLVTRNDYPLGVFNGDVGVVVARPDDGVAVAFDAAEGPREVSPWRLESVETVHAMTVHKSQGSQFGQVAVVLPQPDSRILSRELLYTAVTRAVDGLTLLGSADAVRAAVGRRIQRASGLREALWGRGDR